MAHLLTMSMVVAVTLVLCLKLMLLVPAARRPLAGVAAAIGVLCAVLIGLLLKQPVAERTVAAWPVSVDLVTALAGVFALAVLTEAIAFVGSDTTGRTGPATVRLTVTGAIGLCLGAGIGAILGATVVTAATGFVAGIALGGSGGCLRTWAPGGHQRASSGTEATRT